MIKDILKQKERILSKLPEFGVELNDIQALLLTGSHYWCYDGKDSDVDLILIDKIWKNRSPIKFDEISIEILTHKEALIRNANESNWHKYYLTQYCSYPIFGYSPKLTFNDSKIVEYFRNKRPTEVDIIPDKPIKEGFHSVMKRVFFLNYKFNKLPTFKLTDFKLCNQLDEETKNFMESQYLLLFEREDNTSSDKQRLMELCLNLEKQIEDLSK